MLTVAVIGLIANLASAGLAAAVVLGVAGIAWQWRVAEFHAQGEWRQDKPIAAGHAKVSIYLLFCQFAGCRSGQGPGIFAVHGFYPFRITDERRIYHDRRRHVLLQL
jgi:opacity protein-like surface antigen